MTSHLPQLPSRRGIGSGAARAEFSNNQAVGGKHARPRQPIHQRNPRVIGVGRIRQDHPVGPPCRQIGAEHIGALNAAGMFQPELARITPHARESRSIKRTRSAPRLNASIPNAPEPA